MIKTLFKINIFTIFFPFILKSILKFFFYYYKIKSLNFLLIFFLPYFNNFLNMTFTNKLYEMLEICLQMIFLIIWINWKFIKIRKRKKKDKWRVFILNI